MNKKELKPLFPSVNNLTFMLLSWLCFMLFVLKIGLWEGLALFIFEVLLIIIVKAFIYPNLLYRLYPSLKETEISSDSVGSMPLKMANYSAMMFLIIRIPVLVIIIFFLGYSYPPLLRSTMSFLMTFSTMLYCFLLFHILHSEFVANVDEKASDSFSPVDSTTRQRQNILDTNRKLLDFELIFFILFFLSLVILVVLTALFPFFGKFSGVVILFCGLAMFGRLLFSFRRFVLRKIRHLFVSITDDEKEMLDKLSVHPTMILGKLEKHIGGLNRKMHHYKEEMYSWILHETEYNSSKRISNLAALVAHDLMGPINAIVFCIDELSENSDYNPDDENRIYIAQLQKSTARLMDMVQTLRDTVSNSNEDGVSVVQKVHADAVNLLKMEFRKSGIYKVNISFAEEHQHTSLAISQASLFHILYNIYKNSIENLVSNAVEAAALSISLDARNGDLVRIIIQDNGTGLSRDLFDQYTGPLSSTDITKKRKGLGLRLCRRLVEFYKGGLAIEEDDSVGTTLVITLFRAL